VATAVKDWDTLLAVPAPYTFTGTIAKVTIDLKEIKPADKVAADKAAAEAEVKKALWK